MSRSTYIYILINTSGDELKGIQAVEGVFTVKHEMISWLHAYDHEVDVFRMRDGTNTGDAILLGHYDGEEFTEVKV